LPRLPHELPGINLGLDEVATLAWDWTVVAAAKKHDVENMKRERQDLESRQRRR
jgi:hypothetical protein